MAADGVHALGIDIGGTNVKLALVARDGGTLGARSIPTEAAQGPGPAMDRIAVAARRLLAEHGPARALGVASAGIVDHAGGLVLDAPNLRGWERVPFAAQLGAALDLPVQLENDVNAMAFAEWSCGAGRGARHLLCLTLGTGVGGGLVLNGKLYRGAAGAAGEAGHTPVESSGPRCPCGSTGCLERFVGAAGIVEHARARLATETRPSPLRRLTGESLTPQAISDAADGGDPLAQEILADIGAWLGVGLAGFANLLNPERIVVGGGIAAAGDWILGPARRVLRERAMSVPGAGVEVVRAALGNEASLVGAALLAWEPVRDA
jgi:glucokinase